MASVVIFTISPSKDDAAYAFLLDIQNTAISVSKQYIRNPDVSQELTRSKAENTVRLVSIPQTAVELLIQEHDKHPNSPCSSLPSRKECPIRTPW